MRKRVIIMGAAGRDFHNFNTLYRNNKNYEVVAFTAAQIPNISNRRYPKELSGKLYPKGIKIYPESDLVKLIKKYKVDEVIFSYSDVRHEYVMHKASLVSSAGASFRIAGASQTMLKSKKPVISICAVRTGSGKSQTTRFVTDVLKKLGKKVAVIRHPMPYGDLKKQIAQRFAAYSDLDKYNCTIEEREEYEPHISRGNIVFAGVDYEKILKMAEKEADIIVWDGGNNDTPFYIPDLHLVVADPLRAGHELEYHPGETNLILADAVVINKENSATKHLIQIVKNNIKMRNPKARVIDANSLVTVTLPRVIKNKKVLVIEDGPTLTHGEMSFGAGIVAAKNYKCKLADPRKYVSGELKKTLTKYNLKNLIPAMGYSPKQIRELQSAINKTPCDAVVIATPINLARLIKIKKPFVRVTYELEPKNEQALIKLIKHSVKK